MVDSPKSARRDRKGTRPFRRRPWQAEAASEMAGSWKDGGGAGRAAGIARVRSGVREGRLRERHGDVREKTGTSRLFRRDATDGAVPWAVSAFTRHIWGVNADTAGGVMWTRDVTVTFPASQCRLSPQRDVPVTSPRSDPVPAQAPPRKGPSRAFRRRPQPARVASETPGPAPTDRAGSSPQAWAATAIETKSKAR